MIDLSIIIISYNTKNLLRNCLLSIKTHEPQNLNYELIVVDNGSTDGTVKEISNLKYKQSLLSRKLESQISNIKLIENRRNLGFAKANNQGIKKARGEFILLLNSDTEVLAGSLGEMVKFIRERKYIGILGCKIMNFDGTPQLSTGQFLDLAPALIWLLGGERLGFLRSSPNKIQNVDWVSGACLMIRRSVLDKVGAIDESFFMYMEEMEWCYRVKKANFAVYFYPEVVILHRSLGSGKRGEAILNIYKGLLYFYKKHKTLPEFIIIWILLKVKALVLLTVGFISGSTYLKNTYGEALSIS